MTHKAEFERQAQYERDRSAAKIRAAREGHITSFLSEQENIVSQGLVMLRKYKPKYDSLVSDLTGLGERGDTVEEYQAFQAALEALNGLRDGFLTDVDGLGDRVIVDGSEEFYAELDAFVAQLNASLQLFKDNEHDLKNKIINAFKADIRFTQDIEELSVFVLVAFNKDIDALLARGEALKAVFTEVTEVDLAGVKQKQRQARKMLRVQFLEEWPQAVLELLEDDMDSWNHIVSALPYLRENKLTKPAIAQVEALKRYRESDTTLEVIAYPNIIFDYFLEYSADTLVLSTPLTEDCEEKMVRICKQTQQLMIAQDSQDDQSLRLLEAAIVATGDECALSEVRIVNPESDAVIINIESENSPNVVYVFDEQVRCVVSAEHLVLRNINLDDPHTINHLHEILPGAQTLQFEDSRFDQPDYLNAVLEQLAVQIDRANNPPAYDATFDADESLTFPDRLLCAVTEAFLRAPSADWMSGLNLISLKQFTLCLEYASCHHLFEDAELTYLAQNMFQRLSTLMLNPTCSTTSGIENVYVTIKSTDKGKQAEPREELLVLPHISVERVVLSPSEFVEIVHVLYHCLPADDDEMQLGLESLLEVIVARLALAELATAGTKRSQNLMDAVQAQPNQFFNLLSNHIAQCGVFSGESLALFTTIQERYTALMEKFREKAFSSASFLSEAPLIDVHNAAMSSTSAATTSTAPSASAPPENGAGFVIVEPSAPPAYPAEGETSEVFSAAAIHGVFAATPADLPSPPLTASLQSREALPDDGSASASAESSADDGDVPAGKEERVAEFAR